MPFEELETVPRDAKTIMASVSYEMPKRKGSIMKGHKRPLLIVAIPTVIAGMCKHTRFKFELGTGDDFGKARISGVPKGVPGKYAPGTMMKNALVIRFGSVPSLDESQAAKEHCDVAKNDDNTWTITLPDWMRNETAKHAPTRVAILRSK